MFHRGVDVRVATVLEDAEVRSPLTSMPDGWINSGSYASNPARPDSISALMSSSESSTLATCPVPVRCLGEHSAGSSDGERDEAVSVRAGVVQW